MENNNGKGIFYGVIGVATLVVAIIGATFAFFSATASNSEDIYGNTASGANLALSIVRVAGEEENLIPLDDTLMTSALTGKCTDVNGSNVCQIYKITITNGGSTAVNVKGVMNLTGDNLPTNARWSLITGTPGAENSYTFAPLADATVVTGTTEGIIDANGALTANNGSKDYYLVIWVEETGESQDSADADKHFYGAVTFNAVNADGTATSGITAKF